MSVGKKKRALRHPLERTLMSSDNEAGLLENPLKSRNNGEEQSRKDASGTETPDEEKKGTT